MARKFSYYPNAEDFHETYSVKLTAGTSESSIVVSFHLLGPLSRALLGAVAYFQQGRGEPIAVTNDIFRISNHEPQNEASERFAEWLDAAIIEGLARWRKTLV